MLSEEEEKNEMLKAVFTVKQDVNIFVLQKKIKKQRRL